ncbi:MAG: flagellar hook-basal body complex protein FliE [Rickettsiales bacterium]
MAIDLNSAINAYTNASKMKGDGPAASLMPEEANPMKPSFGSLVSDALNEAKDSNYNSESISALAVAGKAELHELVTSVNNAELALNTVVAVRDKVINAYQDILRMAI